MIDNVEKENGNLNLAKDLRNKRMLAVGNAKKLSGLFSGINKQLSMEKFDDKLEVQKITYVAQEYGIDLGYTFEWNRRGPYCQQVSVDAHTVLDSEIKNDAQSAGLDKAKVEKFASFMKPYIDDTEWLEIAASLIYLRKENYEGKPLEQIIGYLIEDLTYGYKNFNETLVRRVISEMMRIDIFQ